MPVHLRSACLVLAVAISVLPAALRSQGRALVIRDVTLIDGTGRPAVAGAHVLVDGDRVSRVSQTPIEAPGATVIDGRGKWLIPGLSDMHIHLARGRGNDQAGVRALHGFLYAGVTTVFDAGNNADYIFDLRARERAGTLVAPRIFATGGLVTVPGGHGAGAGQTLIESWPEARAALDAHIARQPDMVKFTFDEHGWGTRPLIPLLPPDLMAQAGRYFNEHGIRTTVHISHEFRARQAIAAGIDTLAHPIIQGPVSEEFVRLMASTRTPMVSTLTIGEGYSRLVEHPEFLDAPIYRDTYEPEAIARLETTTREQYAARAWTTWMKVMTPVAQENLRLIAAAGGVIVLGSDQSAGAQSHRELELMVAGGIPPLEAIRIGTLNAAIFLGRDRDLGSIEAGKLADMVLLDADPLADISNAQRIAMVVKGGVPIDRGALDLPVNRRSGGPDLPPALEASADRRHLGGGGQVRPSSPISAFTRASVDGCVENSDSMPRPENGLMMNMWAVAGFASIGTWRTAASIRRSADASPRADPAIAAPRRSAANSRCREIANWITIAANGARMAIASSPSALPPRSSSRPPPP
jgi:imidazolonepropionase-like amidohydrolase